MKKRGRVVGVEEQIDVSNNHDLANRLVFSRKASTSRSSANWFKLAGSIPVLKPIGFGFTMKGARRFDTRSRERPARNAALSVSLKLRRERCMASRTIRSTSLSKVTVVLIGAS